MSGDKQQGHFGRLVFLGLFLWFVFQPASASAAKSDTCGGFTVTVGERVFSGSKLKLRIPAESLADTIQVQGRFSVFDVDPATFTISNYTLTGRDSGDPDKDLPIQDSTVVFLSKVPEHGDVLSSDVDLELNRDSLVLERSGTFQNMKIQSRDCAQGGLFQMEPEPGVSETNTLGPGFTYTGHPAGQSRLCFTNGFFSGFDSPELASPTTFTANSATWDVQAGGRIGMVVGEDALEGGCIP